MHSGPIKGRGTASNPANRFEEIYYEPDPESDPAEVNRPRTRFFDDLTQTILAKNDSPDVGFEVSINPYRGCEHGCVYCYARPTHEYLGFSAGLDFESRILVKRNAPALLRKELSSPRWKPRVIALSGVTDCYQPAERQFRLTRACLEVLAEFRNPACLITKNHLVTRDIDVLQTLARLNATAVFLSVTTLDPALTQTLEPRSSLPAHRLQAIRALRQAGIPVGVMIAPVIPALNDVEIPAILEAAVEAGAEFAGYVLLRLPHGVKDLFEQWLGHHYPDRKEKVLNQIRSMRDGALYQNEFGSRMRGEGLFAEQLARMFQVARRKAGLRERSLALSTEHFRVPPGPQLTLF